MFKPMSDRLYVYACALPSNPLIQNAGTTVKARRTKIHIARPPATPMYTKEMNELACSKSMLDHITTQHPQPPFFESSGGSCTRTGGFGLGRGPTPIGVPVWILGIVE